MSLLSPLFVSVNPTLFRRPPVQRTFFFFFLLSVHKRRSKSEGMKREYGDSIWLLLVLHFSCIFWVSSEHFSSLHCKYRNIITHQVALLRLQPGQIGLLLSFMPDCVCMCVCLSACVCVCLSVCVKDNEILSDFMLSYLQSQSFLS